jgi:hypothetical protein
MGRGQRKISAEKRSNAAFNCRHALRNGQFREQPDDENGPFELRIP